MKKITLHFLWVVVALGMGFHTEARVLNRFTCKGPLHYLEALSHDTSKGISNCLKAGYKAAHTPDSKLAKELAYLGGKSRYGQPLSVMIYLREEMLMKSVDSEFQPDPAFLNQESNRLYAAVFNASSGKGQRHHNAGSISHDIDLGDIHENIASLLMQIAEEDLLPPIFKERVEMLIGKDMYNTLDKFNDVEKELDAAKRAKYRSPKEPTVKELERRLEHLKARIMHHVTEKLTTKDHHIEKEEAKF